ncbi:MAG: hypothetical protein ABI112_14510 [Terracoccus sp.]
MYPKPVARHPGPSATTASPGVPTAAPASDSLSYDAWIRDDWVRSSCPPLRSGTVTDPAEEPLGAGQ